MIPGEYLPGNTAYGAHPVPGYHRDLGTLIHAFCHSLNSFSKKLIWPQTTALGWFLNCLVHYVILSFMNLCFAFQTKLKLKALSFFQFPLAPINPHYTFFTWTRAPTYPVKRFNLSDLAPASSNPEPRVWEKGNSLPFPANSRKMKCLPSH